MSAYESFNNFVSQNYKSAAQKSRQIINKSKQKVQRFPQSKLIQSSAKIINDIRNNQSIKNASDKTKQILNKSRQKMQSLPQSKLVESSSRVINDIRNSENLRNARELVSRYGPAILNLPVVKELLVSTSLKAVGLSKLGTQASSLASILQQKIYDSYTGKSSLLYLMQLCAPTGIFDPTTLAILTLVGCGLYYSYWHIYATPQTIQKAFRFDTRQNLSKSQLNVPKQVNYKDGEFIIHWTNLQATQNSHLKHLI